MKKTIYLFIFTFLPFFLYTQTDNYSIYVSFYKHNKLKRMYQSNHKENSMANKYSIILINNDSIYNLKDNVYFRYNYNKSNLKLIIKKNNSIVLEMDSLEQYYIYDNNTIYLYIGLNNKAKPTSIAGSFSYTDYISSDDNFCINCFGTNNHLVYIESSEGEYEFMHYNFIQRVLIFLHLKKEYY